MPKMKGVRFSRADALSIARYVLVRLDPLSERIAISGSLRRNAPDCGDVDILLIPKHRTPNPIYVQLVVRSLCAGEPQVEGDDIVIADVRLPDGRLVPINVFMTAPENWGAALHYTTGCREYNIAVRGRAKRRGMRADQYGVWRGKTLIPYSGETEESYCQTIGIPWLPPELRTGGSLVARYRRTDTL